MKNYSLLLFVMLFLCSCASDAEKLAMERIAKYYDTEVSHTKGFATTDSGKKSYFNIKIKRSNLVDVVDPIYAGSNACQIFYNSLTEDEVSEYTHIRASVDYEVEDSTGVFDVEFSLKDLELIESKMVVVNEVYELLKNRDYDKLRTKFDQGSFSGENLDEFMAQIDGLSERFGTINDFQNVGFGFYDGNVKGQLTPLLELRSTLMRSNENLNMQVIMSPDPEDNAVYGLHF